MFFLSRGRIGRERDAAFGQEHGLEVWRAAAAGNADAMAKLRTYLLGRSEIPSSLKALLRTENDTVQRKALFSRIVWCAGQPSTEAIAKRVKELAGRLVSGKGWDASVVDSAVRGFLVHCYSAATKSEIELRRLTVETRDDVLVKTTFLQLPPTTELLNSIQVKWLEN